MNPNDEAPKLSPWPFVVADAALLGAAFLIGWKSQPPLSLTVVLVIAGLVFVGAFVATVPFLLAQTRRQDAGLTERQREISALAQSTAATAEQISIAVASLHTIAENAVRSARLAESLPAKLQDKIHDFKEQLNEVAVTENESLSAEVNSLRAAETERIENVASTVHRITQEFTQLEASSRRNVADLNDALSRFTSSAQQAAAEATTAVASLRAGSEKSLAAAQSQALKGIEDSLATALAEIDGKLANLSGHLSAKIDYAAQILDDKIASLEKVSFAQAQTPRPDPAGERPASSPSPAAAPPDAAPAPAASPVAASAAPLETTTAAIPAAASTTTASADSSPAATAATEVPAAETRSARRATAEAAPAEAVATPAEEPRLPLRRKSARRSADSAELTLGLELPPDEPADDYSQVSPGEEQSPALSADGQTRLLVTAYIGIGNKLHVRGEGPGLSWDQGVPLQFVSIGKWRWETADASTPVRLKLFKNDEVECTALGEVTLEAGHQREVAAAFH